MTPLEPIRPADASSLAMENDLLHYEVLHLRARVADLLDRIKDLEQSPTAERAVSDQQAHDDLVWLLRRLDTSPAGVALRRVGGFRILRERYLEGPST